MDIEYVRSRFIKHFDGTTGAVYASPGRINLIGEHTDYNGGFVFPGAIDKGMIAEIKPNGTNTVKAYSIDLKDYVEFGLNEEDAPRASWARYIFGVCREMMKRGVDVKGFNTAFELSWRRFSYRQERQWNCMRLRYIMHHVMQKQAVSDVWSYFRRERMRHFRLHRKQRARADF